MMKISNGKIFHKRGANRKELARRPWPRDPNFAQSRDICEDRGERQIKQYPARRHARIQY